MEQIFQGQWLLYALVLGCVLSHVWMMRRGHGAHGCGQEKTHEEKNDQHNKKKAAGGCCH